MPSRRLPGRGGPPNQPPSESRRFNPEEAATAKTRLQTRLAELRALVPGQPHYVRDANIALIPVAGPSARYSALILTSLKALALR